MYLAELLLVGGLPFRASAEPDLAGFGDLHVAFSFASLSSLMLVVAPISAHMDTGLDIDSKRSAGACDAMPSRGLLILLSPGCRGHVQSS